MSDEGAPAWMVSFGDMMTLILTFFILLVSMADTQQIGLVASGVGSFLVETGSFGLPGILSDHEKAETFDNVRARFNLPPEEDAERRAEHVDASNLELISAKLADSLEPHDEVVQPAIAVFDPGKDELSSAARRYIDLLARMLYPSPGQILVLEGHALSEGAPETPRAQTGGNTRLAYARALAVREYLVEDHAFPPARVKARAWMVEVDTPGVATRSVDARLIIPDQQPNSAR